MFKKQHLALIVFLLAFGCLATPVPADDERPNMVVILVDDMGYSDIGAYGAVQIDTPNLDRLAKQGTRFTQFYNNAKCSQTRASLLTGRWWQQTGMLRNMNNQATVAELLGEAGYRTLMTGKWHLRATPRDRGFDRYFGHLGGGINYFTGADWGSGKNKMRYQGKQFDVPDDFYSTDAFASYAIDFIDESLQKDQPFFLYTAFNAPHFPLQVPEEEIETYRGTFMMGWDRLREARLKRMKKLGIVREDTELSPRDPIVPDWESLSKQDQKQEDQLMATYAGMVDRLDQNVGRLMDHLEQRGVADNTIVMFLSDNGACPYAFNRTKTKPAGPEDAYRTYDSEWANASNTPLRLYKQWAHEGGARTPMIVRWPGKTEPGTITRQPGHLVDLMPTLLEAAGVSYPDTFRGRDLASLPGRSIIPVLQGNEWKTERTLYWEYRGHHGVRQGPWKLVAERGKPWELYHVPEDPTETNDLAGTHPEKVKKLEKLYDDWANEVGTGTHAKYREMSEVNQKRYISPEADDPK